MELYRLYENFRHNIVPVLCIAAMWYVLYTVYMNTSTKGFELCECVGIGLGVGNPLLP